MTSAAPFDMYSRNSSQNEEKKVQKNYESNLMQAAQQSPQEKPEITFDGKATAQSEMYNMEHTS
jgi:hypothetical protein